MLTDQAYSWSGTGLTIPEQIFLRWAVISALSIHNRDNSPILNPSAGRYFMLQNFCAINFLLSRRGGVYYLWHSEVATVQRWLHFRGPDLREFATSGMFSSFQVTDVELKTDKNTSRIRGLLSRPLPLNGVGKSGFHLGWWWGSFHPNPPKE